MVSNVFSLVFDGINGCFDIFTNFLESSGFYPYVLGTLVLVIFFRLIIYPLFGGTSRVGSDSVKKKGNDEE